MSVRATQLIRRETDDAVAAELHDGLRCVDLQLIERSWASERARIMAELSRKGVARLSWPESLHWDWSRKAPELELLATRGIGIFCEQDWQGAMMTRTVGHYSRLDDDSGKPLVYIDFLEAAPWNWPIAPINQQRRFKGVGVTLMREAVKQSVGEGFHGRVGLHALPQAERFYREVCGMTAFEPGPGGGPLVYFEFARAQAKRFLGGDAREGARKDLRGGTRGRPRGNPRGNPRENPRENPRGGS